MILSGCFSFPQNVGVGGAFTSTKPAVEESPLHLPPQPHQHCSIDMVLPLSEEELQKLNGLEYGRRNDVVRNSITVTQMAAALLAYEHWRTGDTTVVPELGSLQHCRRPESPVMEAIQGVRFLDSVWATRPRPRLNDREDGDDGKKGHDNIYLVGESERSRIKEGEEEDVPTPNVTTRTGPQGSTDGLWLPSGENTDHVWELRQLAQESFLQGQTSCAIVGCSDPQAIQAYGLLATLLNVPHIFMDEALPLLSSSAAVIPYSVANTVPLFTIAEAVLDFVSHPQHRSHVAILVDESEYGTYMGGFFETLAQHYDDHDAHHEHDNTIHPETTETNHNIMIEVVSTSHVQYSADLVLDRIRQAGFRTVIVAVHQFPVLQHVAKVAMEKEMIGPDFVWNFVDKSLPLHLVDEHGEGKHSESALSKMMQGAGVIRVLDGFQHDPQGDAFARAWHAQNATLVAALNSYLEPLISVANGGDAEKEEEERTSQLVPDDYFAAVEPGYQSSFVYDAVMAMLLSYCHLDDTRHVDRSSRTEEKDQRPTLEADTGEATRNAQNGFLDRRGDRILPLLHRTSFHGASGPNVTFRERSRSSDGVVLGIFNIRPREWRKEKIGHTEEEEEDNNARWDVVLTHVKHGWGHWEPAEHTNNGTDVPAFLFFSGLPDAPPVLTAVDENFLSPSVRWIGLSLMLFSIGLTLFFVGWIVWRRNDPYIKSAQPQFLYILCLGSILSVLSIIPQAFDESYGLSERQLSGLCAASPWLFHLGYIMSYSAISSKLWRIHQLLQFRRRKVTFGQILMPFASLLAIGLCILVTWAVVDTFRWSRVVVTEFPLETVGRCDSDHHEAFAMALFAVEAGCTILALVMAWMTRDVSERFSESKWLFNAVCAQGQAWLIGLPLIIMVDDSSTDANYLGNCMLFFTFSISSVALIIGPRILDWHMHAATRRQERGQRVHISGLVNNPPSEEDGLWSSASLPGGGAFLPGGGKDDKNASKRRHSFQQKKKPFSSHRLRRSSYRTNSTYNSSTYSSSWGGSRLSVRRFSADEEEGMGASIGIFQNSKAASLTEEEEDDCCAQTVTEESIASTGAVAKGELLVRKCEGSTSGNEAASRKRRQSAPPQIQAPCAPAPPFAASTAGARFNDSFPGVHRKLPPCLDETREENMHHHDEEGHHDDPNGRDNNKRHDKKRSALSPKRL